MALLSEEFESLRELWPYVRPHRRALVGISALAVLASAADAVGVAMFAPVIAVLTGQSIGSDNFLLRLATLLGRGSDKLGLVAMAATFLFAFMSAKNALLFGARILTCRIASGVGQEVRTKIFNQLLSVSYGFWVRHTPGRLLEVLAGQSWRLTEAVTVFCNAVSAASVSVVFIFMLLFLSWQLTAVVAVGVAVVSMLLRPLSRGVRRLGEKHVKANTELWERIWDMGSGIRAIHAFGLEDTKYRAFEVVSARLQALVYGYELKGAASQPLSEVLYLALLITTLITATISGFSLPASVVFVLILFRLHPYMTALDHDRVLISGLTGSVRTITNLLARHDKPYIRSGSDNVADFERDIRFADVTYGYTDSDVALRSISLVIRRGAITAIVGPSGAGKTTLLHLIMRFDDPNSGEILVDDRPLTTLSLAQWRGRLAMSGQDLHLFAASVRENIRYGRLDATDAEIIDAAKNASAHDFIMELPAGYDTILGDQGARLSGGQRQRISLARAFLREPDILLLDEATNALDTVTEQAINRAIARFSSERTVVVVAHRLSTVRDADFVIVIDQGRVVESGSPEELLSSNRMFAEMYNLQRMESRS
jgi:ATP-binding cassette, subfamily B, bacterial MsbA